jgi:hypothetical protein
MKFKNHWSWEEYQKIDSNPSDFQMRKLRPKWEQRMKRGSFQIVKRLYHC